MFVKDRLSPVREELSRAAGRGNFREDNASLALHSYDFGMARARPEAVFRVSSESQLSRIVSLLGRDGLQFLPRGAGTNLCAGCAPLKGGVVLDMQGFNRILEVDTAAGYALVEPGVRLSDLNAQLNAEGWCFGPDPLSADFCTIGGMAAENSCGPGYLRYGSFSSWLLEMNAVLPDGSVAEWKRGAPGPDLPGFFCRSEGTLAIATRFKLRIEKMPPDYAAVLCVFQEGAGAFDACAELAALGFLPSFLEGYDSAESMGLEDGEVTLLYGLAGVDAELLPKVHSVFTAHGGKCAAANGYDGLAALKAKYLFGKNSITGFAPTVLSQAVCVPPGRAKEAYFALRGVSAEFDTRSRFSFRPGDGTICAYLLFDERSRSESLYAKRASFGVIKASTALGGCVLGEQGIGVDRRFSVAWCCTAETVALLGRIKAAADPANLLNPEKIIPVTIPREEDVADVRPPLFPVTPQTKALADEIARRSSKAVRSVPCGMGTALSPEVLKTRGAQPLSTLPLAGIVELDEVNMTVTVGAGMTVGELLRRLEAKGFTAVFGKCPGTVGGAIARGALSLPPDCFLGARLILPDGAIVDLGGSGLKGGVGYQVLRLLWGSWGAFGLIAHVTLRVFRQDAPLPEQIAWPSAPRCYEPEPFLVPIKAAFDPRNLFSPWIFKGAGVFK